MTAEQTAQFEQDGFVVVDRLLTAEQVEKARRALYRLFRGEGTHDRRPPAFQRPLPKRSAGAATNHMVHGRLLDGDLWEIATNERIAGMAARLLRTRSVSLMEDQLIEKLPGGAPVAMHQDAPYLTFLRSWEVINCWIALTDLTDDSAPLLVIRGSHRWPVTPKPSRFADGDEADLMEVVEAARPPSAAAQVVPVVVPAGSGVFFSALSMHGSHRNTSAQPRYAYTLHYAAEECRADTSGWPPNYEPYMVEGIPDGGRITSPFMPVVYPASA